jgi:hypothetical protein
MRFYFFKMVKMLSVVSRIVTPCSLIEGYVLLRGTHDFHVQGSDYLVSFQETTSKMEVKYFPETTAHTHKTARRFYQEDHNPQ